MRSLVRAALAAALLAPIALAGCGDDGGAGADASVTADAPQTPDAAPAADAAPDASPDAAPPGAITITILDPEDQGVAGLDIVFSNADGTLISHQMTDAAGQAGETVPGDAIVTVALMDGGNYALYSIGNVQPGDAIVISDFGADEAEPAVHGMLDIAVPGAATNAEDYSVTDGCFTSSGFDPTQGDVMLSISSACVDGNDQFDIVAQGFVSGQGTESASAHSYLLDQTLQGAGQPVVLPAWSDQFTEVTVNVTNPPAGALGALGDTVFLRDAAAFDIADTSFISGGSFTGLIPDGITPTAVQAQVFALYGAGMNLTGFGLARKNVAGAPASVDVDLAIIPRAATSGTIDTTNPARPILDWNATGTDAVTDMTQAQMFWTEGANEYYWTLITRPNENGPVQLPELPAALSAFAPTGSTEFDEVQVVYLAASWITDDWATIRQLAGQVPAQPATDFTLAASAPVFPAPMAPAFIKPSIKAAIGQHFRR